MTALIVLIIALAAGTLPLAGLALLASRALDERPGADAVSPRFAPALPAAVEGTE